MKEDGKSIEKIYGREDPIKSDFELLPNPRAYDSEKENYEHFFAKLKLYDWLRATQKDNIEKDRIIDVIHIDKEDHIYLEFPVVYPYNKYISNSFMSDINVKYIYPRIKSEYFKHDGSLNYWQEKELIDLFYKYWTNYSKVDYIDNDLTKLIINFMKNHGIRKEVTYELFIKFINYRYKKRNLINYFYENVKNLVNYFYENNYDFENSGNLLETIFQGEILDILNPKIIYYLDLGIVNEGVLEYAIEIVNKSPVSIDKIKYLLNYLTSNIRIIIIPSNVILQQYMMPNHLYGYIYYKNGWFLRKKSGDVEIDISSKKYRKFINFDDHGQRR